MPDLISHLGSGYLAGMNYRDRGWMGFFLFATVLPDLVTRPVYILFPQAYWFVKPLHTPLGMILLCFALSGLFVPPQRNKAFLYLLSGCFLHLGLDLLQKHVHGGYPLLFPLTWQKYEAGLLWPAQMLGFMPFWLAVIVFVILHRHRRIANE